MKELKRERFLRIAPKRTNTILDNIRLLANCANTNNYEYTEQEVKKIFDTIRKELNNAESKFDLSKKKDKFTL